MRKCLKKIAKMTDENFDLLPPFPNDIPTMPLERLSLAKLLQHDSSEYQRFCRACEDLGFFYLDLRDQELGTSILSDADHLFKIGKHLFALDIEEKSKYDHSKAKSYYGYKPLGAGQVDAAGNLDSVEFYNVSELSPALRAVSESLIACRLLKTIFCNLRTLLFLSQI